MRRRLAAAGVAGLVVLAGCGAGGGESPTTPEKRTLTVFAAASLTETFGQLEKQFEAADPGVDVVISYGGSSDLAQQIVNGAPADVFASASTSTMTTVTQAGLVDASPTVFATNVLQIATGPGNPKRIASFADLARPDLKVVVCAPQVPCGAAAGKIESATGVTLRPVSEELDVKSVLGKVTSGDADAGLVYVTDVAAAGTAVQGVAFPEATQASTDYPIAVLTDASQTEDARAFVNTVTGEEGRKILGAAGFGTP